MGIISELYKLRAENTRLRKALAEREASDEPTRGQYHKGELDEHPGTAQCYGDHAHEDHVAAEIAADEQRVADEYAEMGARDAKYGPGEYGPGELTPRKSAHLRATLGETGPAFGDSPLGAGIGPKPYVNLRDPEAFVDEEDDEATEAFMARGRAKAPRCPNRGI